MDSLKSIVVVAILLGVLYGIYQVINDENSPISTAAKSPNILDGLDASSDSGSLGVAPVTADSKGKPGTKKPDSLKSSTASDNKKESLPTPQPKSFEPNQFNPTKTENSNGPGQKENRDGSPGFKYPEKQDQNSTSPTSGRLLVNSKNNPPDSTSVPASKSFEGGALASDSTSDSLPDSKIESEYASPPIQDSSVEPASASGRSSSASISNFDQGNPREDLLAKPLAASSSDASSIREIFPKDSYSDFSVKLVADVNRARDIIDNQDDFEGALRLLTKYYDHPLLIPVEHTNLLSYLDPLAGKVVYSTEHHLTEKHYVRQNESLESLSAKYKVPTELILNINRLNIPNPKALTPGTELKIVEGPFHVEISLSKKRLALFVQGLYAGNFPIRVGVEQPPKPGEYRVKTKSRLGKAYMDQNGQLVDARDPKNPFGDHYLDLGQNIAIHGSAQVSDSNDLRGSISLNAIDAEDVHNILTTDSIIKIVE